MVGDIKQAFLQVEIAEEHRDFVPCLWFKDINETPRKIISLRFTRVAFDLTSSPFLLNGTIKIHVSKYLPVPHYTDIVKKLLLNLYVDDSTNSFDTIETAIEFYEKSKSYLKEPNFELRKWAINSFEMKKLIDSNENNSRSKMDISESETCVENLFGSSSVYRKVLGLNWDTGADDFIFDFENICRTAEKLDVTKRNILRIAAMFFDPLGLISPITLQPKLIFRELCRNKLEWDEVINDKNNIKKWTKFLRDLGQFRLINAPRHVLCCEGRDVKLHGFSDSSGKAYGGSVIVRVSC